MKATKANPHHDAAGKSDKHPFNEVFRHFAAKTADAVGSKWAFLLAVLTILVWGLTGPLFHFSDTWQLVINTGTTIVTFLMVFLIQNTQNRDAKAIHLKLDELIRGVRGARTAMVNLEELSDEELAELRKEFERVRERAASRAERHAEHAHDRASEAHAKAEQATEKAEAALETTEAAEQRASRANHSADTARQKAESAEQRVRRAKEAAENVGL
jgi:low affinity Fe/Cu permease